MSAIELPGVDIDRIFFWEWFFFCSSRALSVIALSRARGVRFFSGQVTYQYRGLRVHSSSAFAPLCSGCCSYSQRNCATRLRYFLLVKCLFAMLIPFIFTLAIASLFSLGVSRPIRHQRSLLSDVEDVFNVVTGEPFRVEEPSSHLSVFKPQLVQFSTFNFTAESGYFELSHGSDTWYIFFSDLEHSIDNWWPAFRIKGLRGTKPLCPIIGH